MLVIKIPIPVPVFMAVIILQSCSQQVGNNAGPAAKAVTGIPTLFAEGIISTGDYETHPALSPSGDTVYFLKCAPDLSACAICISTRQNNNWSVPEIVPFSGKWLDVDPFVTRDGAELYFVSNRPVNNKDTLNSSWDIWKVARNGASWGNPVHLDTPVNSSADEYYPTIADNGNMYFGSSRTGGKGGADIYRAQLQNGVYAVVVNLGDSVNSPDNEYEPFIAPDESYLIYMATRPKGLINADFYVSYRMDNLWTRGEKMSGVINSAATEWSPKVTRDGKTFFFGSTRSIPVSLPEKPASLQQFTDKIHKPGNSLGDIYHIGISALQLKK